MTLKLDPQFPLVWRDPVSLQLGIDEPRVILDDVSGAEERMIAALAVGVSRSGLSMIGIEAGATETDIGRLLARLEPALEPAREPEPDIADDTHPGPGRDAIPSVCLDGSGPTVDRISATLSGSGVRVIRADRPSAEGSVTGSGRDTGRGIDLAVIVAHYVVDPQLHGFWLRRDVPHLALVFGDLGVQLGPIVEPGRGPCLYCLERHRSDADPARPAIASQLWGRRSPAETPLVSSEAAALASRMVLARLAQGSTGTRGSGTGGSTGPMRAEGVPGSTATTGIRLDAASGAISEVGWVPHPECGCLVLPGNATIYGPHRVADRMPPRTGAAPAGRG